ncbi:hypothetical protein [Paenibacillus sp. SYP-B4298]|nr:hypothetical protein [Paenibacillus sp. SYP-B4298]
MNNKKAILRSTLLLRIAFFIARGYAVMSRTALINRAAPSSL